MLRCNFPNSSFKQLSTICILSKGFRSRRQLFYFRKDSGTISPSAWYSCFVADSRQCVGWIGLLSITCTDNMCGLIRDIVKASFWISQMVQHNPSRQGFNNICLRDTMVAANCIASENYMSCNQLLNDAGVLCHCCSYINGWSTVAGGVHDQLHWKAFQFCNVMGE